MNAQNRNLQAAIKTDRSQYTGNRAVEITLTLTNTGSQKFAASLGGKPLYEYAIREVRTGRLVYSGPPADSGRTSGFTLQPGQTVTYREFWDKKDANGRRVPSGAYRIEARLNPQSIVFAQIYLAEGNSDGPGSQPPSEPGVPPGQGVPPSDAPRSLLLGLSGKLTVDKSRARIGDTVTLTYAVTSMNASATPRVLPFTTGQRFDMSATSGGVQQWQWSQDKRFGMSLGSVAIASMETKTFTASWRISEGTQTGPCQIAAYLTVRGVPLGTACRAVATVQILP